MTPDQVSTTQMVLGGGAFSVLLYQLWPTIQRFLPNVLPPQPNPTPNPTPNPGPERGEALTVNCVLRLADQLEAKNQDFSGLADQLRKLPAELFGEGD